MTRLPLKPCPVPGCPNLTRESHCPKHKKERSQQRGSSTQRGYGYRWQKYREWFFKQTENLYCIECGELATVIDHKIPHKKDMSLFWDRDNHQPMCKLCHDRKTVKEDGGLGKAMKGNNVVIVWGPPGGGKTTYVTNNLLHGDITIDYDLIFSALTGLPIYDKPIALHKMMLDVRESIVTIARNHIVDIRTLWIVTSQQWEVIKKLKKDFQANLIIAKPEYNECLRRLSEDKRRNDFSLMQPIVKRWYAMYENNRQEIEDGGFGR